jgi:hypothetical protein
MRYVKCLVAGVEALAVSLALAVAITVVTLLVEPFSGAPLGTLAGNSSYNPAVTLGVAILVFMAGASFEYRHSPPAFK